MSQAIVSLKYTRISKRVEWVLMERESGLTSDNDTMYTAEEISRRGLPALKRTMFSRLNSLREYSTL